MKFHSFIRRIIGCALWLGLSYLALGQTPADSLSDEEEAKLRSEVHEFLDELFDIEMLDKSLQVRKHGREKSIMDQYKLLPEVKTEVTLLTNLNIDELWPKVLTGKKVMTASGKEPLGFIPQGRALGLSFVFDTLQNREAFQVTASFSVTDSLSLFWGAQRDTLASQVQAYLASQFDGKRFTDLKVVPIPSTIAYVRKLLDYHDNQHWARLVRETHAIKEREFPQDIDRIAKALDEAILVNGNLIDAKDHRYFLSLDQTDYPLFNDALNELNNHHSHRQYFVTLDVNYALTLEELGKMAKQVLGQSEWAATAGVALYLHARVHDEILNKNWVQLDYGFTGKSSQYTQLVYEHWETRVTETHFARQACHELFCRMVSQVYQDYPDARMSVTETFCDFIDELQDYIPQDPKVSRIWKDPQVDVGKLEELGFGQGKLAFIAPSGKLFTPSMPLTNVTYDWVNGHIASFEERGSKYISLYSYPLMHREKVTGFYTFIEWEAWQKIQARAEADGNNARSYARAKRELLHSVDFSNDLFNSFAEVKPGDFVCYPTVDDGETCKAQIKGAMFEGVPEQMSTSAKFRLKGPLRSPPIPENAMVLAELHELSPEECEMFRIKEQGTLGSDFIQMHYHGDLHPEEMKALIEIAKIYDEVGSATINDYTHETYVDDGSAFRDFFHLYSPQRTLLMGYGPYKYRDYAKTLRERYELFKTRLTKIPKTNSRETSAELTVLFTDGELEKLSFDQRLYLFLRLSEGPMWSWWNDEEGQAVRLVKTLTKKDEIKRFHEALEMARVEFPARTIPLLQHLDETLGGPWNSNYENFVRVICAQSLSLISSDDLKKVWDNYDEGLILWQKGQKVGTDSYSSTFTDEGNLLITCRTISFQTQRSTKWDANTWDAKRPLTEYVGLVIIDSTSQFAVGLPPVVPAFAVRYLQSQRAAKLQEFLISLAIDVVATLATAGTFAAGVVGLRAAVAVIELVTSIAGMTSTLLAETQAISPELMKELSMLLLVAELGSFSVVDLPKFALKLPESAASFISKVRKLDVKHSKMKALTEFTNSLADRLAVAGYRYADMAEDMGPQLKVVRKEFFSYAMSTANTGVDSKLVELFRSYANLMIRKDVTTFAALTADMSAKVLGRLEPHMIRLKTIFDDLVAQWRLMGKFEKYSNLKNIAEPRFYRQCEILYLDDKALAALNLDMANKTFRAGVLEDLELLRGWKLLNSSPVKSYVKTDVKRLKTFQKLRSENKLILRQFTDETTSSTLAKFLDDCEQNPDFLKFVNNPENALEVKGFLAHKDGMLTPDENRLLAEMLENSDEILDPLVRKWLEYGENMAAFRANREAGNAFGVRMKTQLKDPHSEAYVALKEAVPELDDYTIYSQVQLCLKGDCIGKGEYWIPDFILAIERKDAITNAKYLEVIIVDAKLSGSTGWTKNQIVAKSMLEWTIKTNPQSSALVKGKNIQTFQKEVVLTRKGDFIKLFEISGKLRTN